MYKTGMIRLKIIIYKVSTLNAKYKISSELWKMNPPGVQVSFELLKLLSGLNNVFCPQQLQPQLEELEKRDKYPSNGC